MNDLGDLTQDKKHNRKVAREQRKLIITLFFTSYSYFLSNHNNIIFLIKSLNYLSLKISSMFILTHIFF
jgi:hypothetical protein